MEIERLRGEDIRQGTLFSYRSIEDRIPQDHGIRKLRALADEVLNRLSPAFDKIYAPEGRPSVPPERLLRALLLQVFFSIRSERQLMEQLDYNLLFRWFVGLGMDDEVWVPTVFTKNRDRLFAGDIAEQFFSTVLQIARERDLVSSEHFTVDGTLVQAWASQKSFTAKEGNPNERDEDGMPPTGGTSDADTKESGGNSAKCNVGNGDAQPNDDAAKDDGKTARARKGRNPEVSFRGEKRTNDTHSSKTDPDARLFKKGNDGARLTFMGHLLTENRNGLVIDTRLTHATGTAERDAALDMAYDIPGARRATLGADKGYDCESFVDALRGLDVTPHVAQNTSGRRSNIDGRTTRHDGYKVSQRKRKRVEEVFGWMKTIGGLRQTKHRGKDKVGWMFTFVAAAYNLLRVRNLTSVTV